MVVVVVDDSVAQCTSLLVAISVQNIQNHRHPLSFLYAYFQLEMVHCLCKRNYGLGLGLVRLVLWLELELSLVGLALGLVVAAAYWPVVLKNE